MKIEKEDSGLNSSHVKYLCEKLKLLSEEEKYVSLMLDEIYKIQSEKQESNRKVNKLSSK